MPDAKPPSAPFERRPRMPSRSQGPAEQETPPRRRMPRPGFLLVVLVLLGLNWLLLQVFAPPEPRPVIPYSPNFLQQVDKGNVKRISPIGETVTGEFKNKVRYPNADSQPAKNFQTEIPSFANGDQLEAKLRQKDVVIDARPIGDGRSVILSVLLGFGPVILLVALFVWMARRAGAGGGLGGLSTFARSRARRVEAGDQRVTFRDVAGIDESKQELLEVVDFLKNPDRYQRLGGRLPRGGLLPRPPRPRQNPPARAPGRGGRGPVFSRPPSGVVRGGRGGRGPA